MVDLLGDDVVRQGFEQLVAFVVVELEQQVAGGFFVEQLIEELGLLDVEVLIELGNVGGVEFVELPAGGGSIARGDYFADLLKILGAIFFHLQFRFAED